MNIISKLFGKGGMEIPKAQQAYEKLFFVRDSEGKLITVFDIGSLERMAFDREKKNITFHFRSGGSYTIPLVEDSALAPVLAMWEKNA